MCRRQSPVGFPCSWYESEEAYLKLQSTKIFPQFTSDSDKFHKINTSHTYDQLLSPQPATSTNIYMTIRMQFASTKCRQNVDSLIISLVPSTNRAYFVDKSIIFHNSSTVWQLFVDILSFPDSGLLDMSLSLIEVTSGLMLLPGKVDLRHYPWFWLFPQQLTEALSIEWDHFVEKRGLSNRLFTRSTNTIFLHFTENQYVINNTCS